MTAIAIRFLAGRYHATGWDHHANEGVPEWPPSPWRFLRCLVAAYYRMVDRPQRAELESLLVALQSPPSYSLPPAQTAHTRHYLPTADKTKLVVDSFVAVGTGAGASGGEIVVSWPGVRLTPAQQTLLGRLLDHIGYLGRAESWVECALVDGELATPDARPLSDDESSAHEARLLAPMPESDYRSWRAGWATARRACSVAAPPESLLGLLEFDTLRLHAERWSVMPGTRWLRYGFAADPFRPAGPSQSTPTRKALPCVARYAVHSAVLPLLADAIAIGERMRQALLAHSRDGEGLSHPVFLGRGQDGLPMQGNRHAYFLPEDADGDGHIDHVMVWCRDGFDARATKALHSVTRLWGSEGHDLWLALVGVGGAADYGTQGGRAVPGASAACGRSRIWRSATPFVPPRHPKRRGGVWSDLPAQQLSALLQRDGRPPAAIEGLPDVQDGATACRWSRFRRRRQRGGGAMGMDAGFGYELRFDAPVQGPIAVGYGAHFGMGRFEAVV